MTKLDTKLAVEHRCAVTWAGAGQPITFTIYDPNGAVVSVPLSPTRALELAKELIAPAVRSIKTDQWGEGWPG